MASSSLFPSSLKNTLLLLLFATQTTNSFVLLLPSPTPTSIQIKKANNNNININNNRPSSKSSSSSSSSTTVLYLEDSIAYMIDRELRRQAHKKEYENEWMEKNRAAVFAKLDSDFVMERDDNQDFVMHKKDEKLAKSDPQKYCADRCITTGNCDVYEDFFEMSPEQVIEFCTECVLSEDEEECQIPDGFYDKLMA